MKTIESAASDLRVPGIWTLIWKPVLGVSLLWIGLVSAAAFMSLTPPEFLSSLPSWQLTETQWTAVAIGSFSFIGLLALVFLIFQVRSVVRSQTHLLKTRLLELSHSNELELVRVTSHEQIPLEGTFKHLLERIRLEKKTEIQAEVRTALVRMASGMSSDLKSPLASLRAFSQSWASGQATPSALLEQPLMELERLANELAPQRKATAQDLAAAQASAQAEHAAEIETARILPLVTLVEALAQRIRGSSTDQNPEITIEVLLPSEATALSTMTEVSVESWMKPILAATLTRSRATNYQLQIEAQGAHQVRVLLLDTETQKAVAASESLPTLSAMPAPWSKEIPHPQRGEVVVLDSTGTAGELLQRRCENGDFPEITSLYAVTSTKELQGLLQEKPSLFERAIFLIEPPIPNERRSALEWAESLGLIRNSAILTRHAFDPRWIQEAISRKMRLIPLQWLSIAEVQPAQGLGLARQINATSAPESIQQPGLHS